MLRMTQSGVQNRDIPPLDYDRVFRLKEKYPNQFIGINGGIENLNQAMELMRPVDGAMLGRAAYHNASLLVDVDALVYGDEPSQTDWLAVRDAMMAHAARHIEGGGQLIHVTRHMVGLFHGLPGARQYRQILSTGASRHGAGPEVIEEAFAEVHLPQKLVA